MTILETALKHFQEDMARARALLDHASNQQAGLLADDVIRAAWMMGVGACDAYFSDAYADLITRTLRAKTLEPTKDLPNRLNNLKLPVSAFIRQPTGGWRWRMAARELIESENILSIEKIAILFNQFFPKGQVPLTQDTLADLILHPNAKSRLFGINSAKYRAKNASDQAKARKNGLEKLKNRFSVIFQRRHDCIHNCDRPKVSVQRIKHLTTDKALEDIAFLVERYHEALVARYPSYLADIGFNGATRNNVCT
jgi:hypothetical protein